MQSATLFFSILFFVVNQITCHKNTQLKDCDVNLLSCYECDADEKDYAEFNMSLKYINENGSKAVDIRFNLTQEFNESYRIIVTVDTMRNGNWDPILTTEQPFCTFMEQYGSKIWEDVRQQSVPPIESECQIAPAYYVIEDFECSASNTNIPTTMEGRHKIKAIIINDVEKIFACKIFEVEVSEKQNSK